MKQAVQPGWNTHPSFTLEFDVSLKARMVCENLDFPSRPSFGRTQLVFRIYHACNDSRGLDTQNDIF